MARLHTSGFELNDSTSSTPPDPLKAGSGATVQSTTKRSGAFAAKNDSTAGNISVGFKAPVSQILFGASRSYFARIYCCFSHLPASTKSIFELYGTGYTSGISVSLTSGGKLQLRDRAGAAQIGSDSAATIVADGTTWYRIDLSWVTNGSTLVASGAARLNGTLIASGSVATPFTPFEHWVGWNDAPGASKIFYADDWAVNDSTGAAQTSYPEDAKVVLLKPVSDNARGANWTGGAGGTSNLFDALDNLPPVGLAVGSGTNTSQVKNAASDATGNYDADLTDYAAAGLVAGDTINVVHPFWVTGESGTDLTYAMLLVSNPQANAGTASTDTTGTSVAGTHPSNWNGRSPAAQIVYAPSPTLGTKPVLRLGKRTANVAALMSDAMGAYVDYTPAVVGGGGSGPRDLSLVGAG